ncbi:VapE domain-containing protein [uncultured Prevotella sp.]|uniref:VapE domain-containing protein n=1 Tax=uncultured Prevotella sp. TaxID=159272 RepID=UPI0025861FEA|nr:VapE domain-containing protein [uncultured Prevotella sp.]
MQKNDVLINGGALNAPVVSALAAEQFLTENYCFRRNLLNGKVEFATKQADGQASDYRPLTQEALNSIILRAKREDICEGSNPKTDIVEFIHSEEVCAYNPIREYLDNLPQWDGQNHVAQLFSRLPGLSSEQLSFLSIWLRSTVGHWLQMDTLHGNEIVPTLIGAQGCGKTTFFKRLLPANLRQYFLDHLNLSNKFDKEMALTNNLLVCLDELEAIRPSQQASLKQTLSKSKVNGRPIYGCAQEDRARFASFVSTTNNPHPLSDATGSRRYICLQIPQGQYIDNSGEIDYDQLYAQVVYELREQKAPYWFNNDEVARIQQLNQEYMEQKDIVEIINLCFRKPEEGDAVQAMNSTELLRYMRNKYPSLPDNLSTRIRLGQAMSSLDFDSTSRGHVSYYRVALVKQETKAVKAA